MVGPTRATRATRLTRGGGVGAAGALAALTTVGQAVRLVVAPRPLRLTPFTAAQAVAAGIVLARLAKQRHVLPPLHAQSLPADAPRVSVVIPARDEVARIGPCLASVCEDPQVYEVIVVDDRSTDGTAEVAAKAGAKVVTGAPLPSGWVGKQWALCQGVQAATGDWVMTLDADAVPDPGLVGAAVSAAVAHGYDLLTVGPRFRCDTLIEQALHPSLLATLVYRYGPVGLARQPAPDRLLANGQCMVFRRGLLADGAGFDAIRGEMTDDIALARWIAARGGRVGMLNGARLLSVKMHAGGRELWREWGRSIALPGVTGPAWQAADLAVVWLTLGLPGVRLAARRGTALDAALLAARLGVGAALVEQYERPRTGGWLAPLLDPVSALRLTASMARPRRTWRTRTY